MLIDPYRLIPPPESFFTCLNAEFNNANGVGNFSVAGNSAFWDWGTDDFTIQAWARNHGATDGSNHRIARAVSGSGGTLRAWEFRVIKAGAAGPTQMRLALSNGATTTTVNSSAFTEIPLDTWAHYAVSVDRTGELVTFVLNGVEISQHSIAAFAGLSPTSATQTVTLCGAFNASIDDFRVYSEARSTADILDDYDHPLTVYGPTLGAYWKFNEGTGTTAEDAIAGTLLTLAASVTWDTGPT